MAEDRHDQLRIAACELEHQADRKKFPVTFSAGVAAYPEFATPHEVIQAADAALHQAKHAGCNRVMVCEARAAA